MSSNQSELGENMTDPLSRDGLIEDLQKLGSEDEQEILQAARRINQKVSSTGLEWNDLLTAESDEEDDGNDEEYSNERDSSGESDADDGALVGNDEVDKLLGKLLARSDCSPELRKELEGYKEDIKTGEFDDSDRRYIKALFNRLKS